MVAEIVLVLLTVFSLAKCFALPFEGLYKLDIVHYNDFHARFEETSVLYSTCCDNNDSCLGGFPRLYHQIKVLLKEKPNAILLNAGDSFQGTYWYTLFKWNITQEFMNLLPHDAHALGNHEFDDGPEGLAPYLSRLKAPVIAANMDVRGEPSLQGLFQNHTVVVRNGRKIGLIGLITTTTAILATPGNVVFTEPGEALAREAKLLTEKGVDIIVVLSHCGLEADQRLARDYGEHVDIIVGGHTHSLLWNGPSPSGEAVAGPYPVFVESSKDDKHQAWLVSSSHSLLWNGPSPSGEAVAGPYPVFVESSKDDKHQVLIVQASAFTKYMGNLSVYFDYLGNYVKWEGGPIFLNRSIDEDLDIKSRLAPYAVLVHQAVNKLVGTSLTTLRFEECVFGECALGDLLTDAFMTQAKKKVKSVYPFLAFNLSGHIKTTIPAGSMYFLPDYGKAKRKDIPLGKVLKMFPFNNRIQCFELQGRHVLEALERSVSDAWAYNPFKGPWVLQVAGLRVTYNVTLGEGHRVMSVLVGDESHSIPLEKEGYYQVVAPHYLGDGGDGFTMFSNSKKNERIVGREASSLAQYIKTHSPLNVTTSGRIKILN